MRSRSCTSRARSSTSADPARRSGAATGRSRTTAGPDRGLGPRRGLAAGLVRPGRAAAGDPAADGGAECRAGRLAAARRDGDPEAARVAGTAPCRTTYLERLAARSRAVGTVLCLGLDPDPDGLPPGFSRTLDGLERFATLLLEAASPVRRRRQAEPRLLRGLRIERDGRPRTAPGDAPRGPAGHRRREARRHRHRRPRARRSRCSTRSARTPSPSTRTSGPRPSRRCSSGRTGSPTSCAGPPTPGAGELQDLELGADAASGAPGGASPPARGAPGDGLGSGRDGRPRRRRHGTRRARRDPRDRARTCRSSSRVSAPRAARSSRSSAMARPRRAAGRRRRPAAACWSTSRAASPAPRWTAGTGRPRSRRVRAAAAEWAARLPVLP